MSDLRSANPRALLFGWLPWLFEPLRLSSAALERFGTDCSALSQRIASDCMRALVGLHVWLVPFECSRCVQQRSVGSTNVENEISHRTSASFSYPSTRSLAVVAIHFVLLVELTGSVAVECLARWILTACVHCIRWRRWHCFFLYHFRLFLKFFPQFISQFFSLARSHEASQPNHRSASSEIYLWSSRWVRREFNSDLQKEEREKLLSVLISCCAICFRSFLLSCHDSLDRINI